MNGLASRCSMASMFLISVTACTSQPGSPSSSASPAGSQGMLAGQSKMDQVLRGRAIIVSNACGDCHRGGSNPAAPGWLAGVTSRADSFPVGPFNTFPRNLTPDSATGTGKYTERQIFNALRYGLRPSVTPDVDITGTTPGQGNFPATPHYLPPSMPWAAWRHMPDEDLRAIAAYLKNGLKPVSNKVIDSQEPPDHWAAAAKEAGPYPTPAHPTASETAVNTAQVMRGRELVIRKDCGGCHGGGPNPSMPNYLGGMTDATGEFQIGPFKTRPRNITPDNTTGIGRFTERQIFNSLRYGLRPGETPDVEITSIVPGQGNFPERPKFLAPPMPWPSWRHMPDEDLRAIAAYLKQGVKPVSNKVADSEGPPDFWASEYTVEKIGPRPAVPFPTANERALR